MKKLFTKYWREIVLILAILITIAPLLRSGYFPHHDDLQFIRLLEIRKCFADFQIPCRWVPDMGFGFGYPLYNFYSVFPYYLGGAISYIFSFINTAKILFMLTQIIAGVGMYLLAKHLFNKNTALVSSVLYLYAPYKAVDIYVRGALSEGFALALIPFIFYFIFKLSESLEIKTFAGITISFTLFLLTHNISTLLFSPVILLVLLYLFLTKRESINEIFLALIMGFGMAAFFLLPAFFEKDLVQTESLTRFELNYRSHFVSIAQFISTKWGYGPSVLGPNDSLSFQVGFVHLLLAGLAITVILLRLIGKKMSLIDIERPDNEKIIVSISAFLLLIFSLFMAHYRSAIIWELSDLLSYIQFPWRFLGLTSFFASIAGGSFVYFVIKKRQESAAVIFSAFIIAFNFVYFRPSHMYQTTDAQKFSNAHWRAQIRGSILDYLPKTAVEPVESAAESPWVNEGMASVINYEKWSNGFKFDTEVVEDSQITIPVFYFPEWKIKVGEGEYFKPEYDRFGRMLVNLPQGSYIVEGRFFNTPVRNASNLISVTSLVLFSGYLIYAKNKPKS